MTDFLTQAAWAERLGVSIRTFRRWRELGAIPAPDCSVPGRPRWSLDLVKKTTLVVKVTKRDLFARRQQRPLQSSLSRPVDGQGSRKASDLSRQSVSDLHAGSVSAAEQPEQVHSVEGSR